MTRLERIADLEAQVEDLVAQLGIAEVRLAQVTTPPPTAEVEPASPLPCICAPDDQREDCPEHGKSATVLVEERDRWSSRAIEAEAKVAAEREKQEKARLAAEAKERKEQAAREAKERKAKEKAEAAAKKATEKAEAAEVASATLREAAIEVVACFEAWGVVEELPARKLAAAVERKDGAA